ncbi:MAG TPA: SURF1 family protein [Eoetvoesiella sp.]
MARSNTTFYTFSALILLSAMAAVFVSLGNWQLDRAAQREAISQAIQAGRQSQPLHLTASTPDTELVQWRSASASGVWLHELTVLLENRNFKTQPGYWVATPLLIEPASRTALLVLRGWLPRPAGIGTQLPAIPQPTRPQTISGQLVSHVPRLFELWSFGADNGTTLPARLPSPDKPVPTVQNLDLEDYTRATGLKLLPIVLEQTSTGTDISGIAINGDAALKREWPLPPLDASKNRGYALQWFGFAAIAAGAWLVVAWRALRRRKKRSDTNGTPSE